MPLVLYGQNFLKIDAKNRLGVPASIRKEMSPERDGKAFFIVTGDNGKLWLYPEKIYEAMAEGAPQKLAPGEQQLEFDHLHYALAEKRELDDQGRILLNDDQLKETRTGKDIVLFGSRNHLEIWNRSDWEEHRANLQARRKQIQLLAQQGNEVQGK